MLDPAAGDPASAIALLTDGARADVTFECVGSPAAFAAAFRAAGKGGRMALVGLVPEAVTANALLIVAHEKEIIGSSAYVDEFPDAIDLLARGQVRIDSLVTARVPLKRALADGIEALLRPDLGHVKILLSPGALSGLQPRRGNARAQEGSAATSPRRRSSPLASGWTERAEFPSHVFRKLGTLGLMGLLVHERYGGRTRAGRLRGRDGGARQGGPVGRRGLERPL